LVVYTDGAAQANGGDAGIKAMAGLAVGNVNTALQNSGIGASAALATSAIKWSHSSSGDVNSDMNALTGDTAITALRTQHSADLVAALIPGSASGTTGLGTIGQLSNNPNACWSVCRAAAVGAPARSFAHEIGHNLGAGHDAAAGGSAAEPAAKGWKFDGSDGKQYRTQMGYPPGIRIPYYSNPNKSYQGKPTGTASANNAATITKVSLKVEGYE
jgi:hypothetical protein